MMTQEITLDQSSDAGLYTQLLRGRYVTSVEGSVITLDDGTELYIYGNEGCGGCSSGWYWLEETFKQGSRRARIMSAYVDYDEDDKEPPSVYTIFVMVDGNPTQLPLATVRGNDGNGYYGTGFTLTATVNGTRVPATDFLLSEVCGLHGHRIGPEASFIPDWIFFHPQNYGVRIIKHRAGGRGDVTIYSDSQSVWAVNPQKGTAS